MLQTIFLSLTTHPRVNAILTTTGLFFTYFKLCTKGIMKNLSFVVWFLLILYVCDIHHVMCILLGSIVFILFTDHRRYPWYCGGRMYLFMAFGERISAHTHMFWKIMRPSLSRLNLVLYLFYCWPKCFYVQCNYAAL